MKVPRLTKNDIAERALGLIADYRAVVGSPVSPPIPVEDIIERYLGVKISYEDLVIKLGIEDVLGATYVKSRLICIDRSLLEDKSEGRLIFTCGHELGHWILHRSLREYAVRTNQRNDSIICRVKNAKEPIEWQADCFAACLLMPEREVREAFHMVCGDEPVIFDNIKSSFGGTAYYVDPCVENWHLLAAMVREAGGFTNVSKQAMAIRLQELGLLINKSGVRLGWRNPYSRP